MIFAQTFQPQQTRSISMQGEGGESNTTNAKTLYEGTHGSKCCNNELSSSAEQNDSGSEPNSDGDKNDEEVLYKGEITNTSSFRTYTKIKRLGDEENKDIFLNPEDEIVIQEKMDGANFRFMFKDGKIIFGSRTQMLSEDKEHKFQKNFNRCIEYIKTQIFDKVNLDLSYFEGMVFYGECMVAHSMQYDWDKVPPFLGFDINNESNQNFARRFLPYPINEEIFRILGLPFVPIVKICKAKDIGVIDDNAVPISKYAIPSGTDDTRKAEGIVMKKYKFGDDRKDGQIFAKYVRDKFKEINAEVFGSKSVKYNGEDNTPDLVFKYCTNARIDKIIFKLLDEGKKLSTTLMPDLIRGVLNDIYEEASLEIVKSDWVIDFPKMRKLVPKRCIAVLNQVITNNALKGGEQ